MTYEEAYKRLLDAVMREGGDEYPAAALCRIRLTALELIEVGIDDAEEDDRK